MSANSLLKQYSDERAALVEGALNGAVAVILGRRRVLSGIRWRKDLIVTAAEAVGDAEQADVRLEGDEWGAEVIATDLTTDVSILRLAGVAATAPVTPSAADISPTSDTSPSADTTSRSTSASPSAAPAAARTTPNMAPTTPAAAPTTPAAAPTTPTTAPTTPAAARTTRATAPTTSGVVPTTSSAVPTTSTTVASASAAAPFTRLLRVGESVVVVGRNLRGPAAIWGSVQLAGPAWSSRRGGRIDQRLELDVAFDPSFEGGAVIDMDGNVVAMAVPGPYHRILAIPAATIEAVVSKVDQFGRLPKPYIGIRLQPLWLDDDTRTKLGRKSRGIAAVGGVDEGSPAAEAHIELGDLLLALDGEPAESVHRLAQRIAGINPGQTIALEVLRGGKPLTINVQVGERPHH